MPEHTIVRPSQSAAQAAESAWRYIWQGVEDRKKGNCDRITVMRIITDELRHQGHDNPQNRIAATKLLLEKLLTDNRARGPQLLRLRPGIWRKARRQELRASLEANHAYQVATNEIQLLRFEQLEEQLVEANIIDAPVAGLLHPWPI